MSVAEKTCRTCGKTFENEDGSGLFPLFNSLEYVNEIKMALTEFEIWNLNITCNDGLPQKICLTCFDSFCQIHNFRMMCIEAQMNFEEMCTGLDIIIRNDITDDDDEFRENLNNEQLVIVHEHFTFPGDELLKTSEQEFSACGSDELVEEHLQEEQEQELDIVEKEKQIKNSEESDENVDNEDNDKNEINEEFVLDLKQHRCEFCMGFVSFDDPDDLNSHYNVLHSSIKPYPCPKCPKRFDKSSKRNSHVRCHFSVTPLECEYCHKKFRGDEIMMAEHIAYYHVDKNRECPICQTKFENISLKRYFYHMRWHNESKLLKCRFCDKKFIQGQHLKTHEKTHVDETKFVCHECGLGYKNSLHLNKHMLLHENNELVECPKCPKKFFTRVGIKLHNMKVHNPNKKPSYCEICDKTFIYEHDLVIHNHKKHGGPAQKFRARTGPPISVSSTATAKRKKRILNQNQKQTKKNFIKPYKCDKCDEAYILQAQFLKHVKIHDEYRPHKCSYCSKSFKRDAHLTLHVNNIHFNIKPYKCLMCAASYVQKSHLTDHIAIRHEKDKRKHQCKICFKKFGTNQVLKIHSAIHSTERPHVCEICQKGFKQRVVLKSHMKRIHLSNVGID